MTSWWPYKAPSAWAAELDFVGPRVRASNSSWLLLLVGVLACAWLAPQVQEVDDQQADLQATLKRLQRASHQQQMALQAAAAPNKDQDLAPALTSNSAQRAAQLALWLGYPWMQVIARTEDAARAEEAVLLSWSLDLSTLGGRGGALPEIRVSAAVRDDAAALRWVQAQGSAGQLLSRDKLAVPFTVAQGTYEWRADAQVTGGQP